MATNKFPIWNPTQANQETDAEYATDSQRVGGAPTNAIFPSATGNKVFNQASTMVNAIAQIIANVTGQTIDDASSSLLTQQLLMMLLGVTWCGTTGGSANAQTLAAAVAPTTYLRGNKFSALANYTNTGATTINVSSLGAVNVLKKTSGGLVALTGGEIVVGQEFTVTYDGANFQLDSALSTTGSLTSPGYYTLPGGLIIQWGQVNFGAQEPGTGNLYGPYNFPLAFPNACLATIFTTLADSYATDNAMVQALNSNPPSATQFWFGLKTYGSVNATAYGVNWLAIGW